MLQHRSLTLRSVLFSVLAALAVTGFSACGDDEPETSAPASIDIPAGAIATVGDQQITGRQIEDEIEALERAPTGDDTPLSENRKVEEALRVLLHRTVLEQEARRLGVEVTDAEVRERVAISTQQFTSEEDRKRFFGEMTEEDIGLQLRRQLLSDKIAEKSKGDAQRTLARMNKRWERRTTCHEDYLVEGCREARASQ